LGEVYWDSVKQFVANHRDPWDLWFLGAQRMRQYLASQVTLNGNPMEYQGTVKEHVLGALKFVVAIRVAVLVYLQIFSQEMKEISAQHNPFNQRSYRINRFQLGLHLYSKHLHFHLPLLSNQSGY
jgi:hypothetical protein